MQEYYQTYAEWRNKYSPPTSKAKDLTFEPYELANDDELQKTKDSLLAGGGGGRPRRVKRNLFWAN
jgi:hypothetical protein